MITFFPPELVNEVLNNLDYPLSLEAAKKHRLKLMEERKYFID